MLKSIVFLMLCIAFTIESAPANIKSKGGESVLQTVGGGGAFRTVQTYQMQVPQQSRTVVYQQQQPQMRSSSW